MAVKFFDEQWYLKENPDVAAAVAAGGITAEQHFEQFGVSEGRSPSPLFDPEYYLEHNADVKTAVEAGVFSSAYDHFQQLGHGEGRKASPYFDVDNYLAENADVKAAVEAGGISAYEHYQQFGLSEGRSPLAFFDADYYLDANSDVAAAVLLGLTTPARHFITFGGSEERTLSPVLSIGAYLAANADVNQAVEDGLMNGLEHLLVNGVREGRDLGYGVSGEQFASDPVYQEAIQKGDFDAALARMSDVSPFLPEFEAPEGFVLPADWPIPQGFVPQEGTVLTVPDGWVPSDPTRLPDYFEQKFAVEVSPEGVVTIPADATGEIAVVNIDGQAAFAYGGYVSAQSVPLDGTATVNLTAQQVLVGLHSDIGGLNVTGAGSVRANGTAEADVIDASEWSIVNLTIDAQAGDDTITIADTQTAIGGEGADTFVISATAGAASVITVDDYDLGQGDVIDLTEVEGFDIFAMEVRGAEHNGETWVWGPEYTGDSIGIWFAGEVANVQVTGARTDTMKFALPEREGLEGYDSLLLNISNGGVIRADEEAGQILRGGSGTQYLVSGEGADILTGGAGADAYVIQNASQSSLDSIDRILDLEIGTDSIVSHTAIASGNFVNGGTLAALNAESIGAALTQANFGANAGAYFTVGEGETARTFVALNDGTAGYDAAADTLIEITGATGDLAALSVVGVPDLSGMAGAAEAQAVL